MLIDRTAETDVRLLVDATRRASTHGPGLARAHREVGKALASTIATHVSLEEVSIEHVTGVQTGVQIARGSEPVIIALLRAGLFVAEGIWERLPGATLHLHHGDAAMLAALPLANRTVVVVDAVINSGSSMRKVLDVVQGAGHGPACVVVATLVGHRSTMEALALERPDVQFVAARLSDNSYVGRGGTDTGARLFGTTNWATER